MGKRKIDIKKINNKNYLKATFSKRRKGLFRKATDLCCLSGAQIAIITFSPGNKAFIFGQPSAETVIDRFLGEQASCTTADHDDEGIGPVEGEDGHEDLEANHDEEDIGSVDAEDSHEDSEAHQEEEKEDEAGGDGEKVSVWWDEPIDENLGLDELKKYKGLLECLKENVASKLDERNKREFYTKDYLAMLNSEIGSTSTTCQERDLCD
ncbi:PREDICTED: agamous [Prunus dulcis]|uniref:PREDICTED: agamous n=1 Tax=Prunus dulcis TaxID=3755 RepID=A0A5E4G3T9_PRUDU|nr:agamous-like MADS-box protein AGL62 [Prunus dulcis]XP_034222706.1 agamous-like MADS-box protein AGL62 [Prunus dulcis]VVA34340.1 PREDICTED: agamous [Prunus dulcis]VVA41517.1 PREDICTED: agamous [Prunus dulcis]